jgi:hypothetical protein
MLFVLPDALIVALSQRLSKSTDCTAFVGLCDGDAYYFAGVIDGILRWQATEHEIDEDEFIERSRVIPWSVLPLSQQVMFGFAIAAWMQNQAKRHGIWSVVSD